jgi:hypothetical protein
LEVSPAQSSLHPILEVNIKFSNLQFPKENWIGMSILLHYSRYRDGLHYCYSGLLIAKWLTIFTDSMLQSISCNISIILQHDFKEVLNVNLCLMVQVIHMVHYPFIFTLQNTVQK